MCNYKHALLFYRLINQEIPYVDYIDIHFQQCSMADLIPSTLLKQTHKKLDEI